jgi:hypothetical protein
VSQLRPSKDTSSLEATQLIADPSQSHKDVITSSRLTFAQSKIDELDEERWPKPGRRGVLTTLKVGESLDNIVVHCQCGHADQEGEMVSQLKHELFL